MSTKLWAVRTGLVTVFTAAMPTDVQVFDGPMTYTTPPKRFLLVGTDGGEDGGGATDDGSTIRQELSDLGPGIWRSEAGEIVCAAWAWSGDTKFVPLRTAIAEITDACETALADRTLAGILPHPSFGVEFGAVRFREEQTPNGAVARAVFTVSYSALLT